MSYLRGFAPWIAFSATSAFGWQWAALIALVASGISLTVDRRAGTRIDGQILTIGMTLYFAALAALAFAVPDSPVQAYDSPISTAWLGLIALTSLAVGRPFTLGVARRRVPAEVADSPRFRTTNMVITAFWTAGFVFMAAAGFTCVALDAAPALRIASQVVGIGLPMLCTHLYAARLRARRPQPAVAMA
ncbi:hypothetical protein FPZ12_000110 [Amycolatopsis acidicola]|uniref:DUF3159 domain-containing protein n=1 Tax=Amycolatopsis acidicola TaxID=2596893 RepID=A0A5N0VJW0_9PSEU|nr:hypothetical protein [Amycolatopsis acidicola]KAA9166667.1 hypothetical protein FPZ12_000110 [Amycolatopsis acidicola]